MQYSLPYPKTISPTQNSAPQSCAIPAVDPGVGSPFGWVLGPFEGSQLGFDDGSFVGILVGCKDGIGVGNIDEAFEGCIVGICVGILVENTAHKVK